MTHKRRKTLSLASAIVLGLATVLGILVDLPRFVSLYIRDFPEWMRTANVVWAMSLAAVYGIIALLIWKPFRRKTARWMVDMMERSELMFTEVTKILGKHKAVVKVDRITEMDPQLAARFVEHVKDKMPRFLRVNFGKEEVETFMRFLSAATSTDARKLAAEVMMAVIKYCVDFHLRQVKVAMKNATDLFEYLATEPKGHNGEVQRSQIG